MVDFARFAGLDDEADRGAQALADQVMVDARRRQQRRNRHAVAAHRAVGQDDDVVARMDRHLGVGEQLVERRLHAGGALARPDR